MIVFRILSGGKEGKIVKSDLDIIYAGRKPECILQLDPYQDLSVHGQHAKIYKSSGHYYLEDLNSKNGTFVNEQPIKAPIQLKQGLVFRLGGDGPEIEVYDCKVEEQEQVSKIDNTFLLKRLDTDTVFNFDKTSVRLGRQPDCELALDPLKNREVSGYHALICCRDDGYYLEDLQSANGTFLNGVICKNSKLQNLDIVQLGKEGPKFQFLYQGSSSLESLEESAEIEVSEFIAPEDTPIPEDTTPVPAPVIEVEAETVIGKEAAPQGQTTKPIAKRKTRKANADFVVQLKEKSKEYLDQVRANEHYKKAVNYVQEYQKESIAIGLAFVLVIVILFSVFSRNVYDKTSLFETYNETIVPIYSRYLVRVNGKTIRGQMYSTGVLYNSNGKTNVIALRDSIFPWRKKFQDKVEELIHIIAIWPSHTPIFDKSLGYHTLDFTYSYNNDHTRIGGKELGDVKVNSETCKIIIDSVVPFSLPKKDVLINPQKKNQEEQVFSIYTSPEDGIDDKGTLSKVVTEGKVKGPNLMISCKSQGAPIFNTYGEIIGVYLDSNLVPINY